LSQVVGQVYKSRIPTLGDDASIQEALRVYHYGVDNYSTQPIPDDSIEGNFRSFNTRVASVESSISTFANDFVRLVSQTSAPNIITAQSTTVSPLTVRSVASQTAPLQSWQNSSSTNVANMSTGGAMGLAGYLSVGSTTVGATVASSINIINSSHKGIVVRAANSQTANIQEWQDSAGSVLLSVSSAGALSSTSSITASGNISTSGNISATSNITAGGSIKLTAAQTLDDFRVRNVRASTSQPSGGNDGDVWLVYV
jgi:hypothetical protein